MIALRVGSGLVTVRISRTRWIAENELQSRLLTDRTVTEVARDRRVPTLPLGVPHWGEPDATIVEEGKDDSSHDEVHHGVQGRHVAHALNNDG